MVSLLIFSKIPKIMIIYILCLVLDGKVEKPKDWKKNLWELDTENPENNGLQNEDLIVWMRTAAFPNFRKLYRRIDHNSTDTDKFNEGLKKGNYTLNIEYSKLNHNNTGCPTSFG